MAIPATTLENHLIGSARQHAAEQIEAFTTASFDDEPAAELCARASAMFDTYCGRILNGFLSAVSPVDGLEIDWVRGHYLPLVIQFATDMRDSIADALTRTPLLRA